jgi:hypothetical protein
MTIRARVVKNNTGKITGATMQQLAGALYMEAEAIMRESKANYVPVDTGALRNSGTVLPPKVEPKRITVEFGYGGAAVPYAAAVHEYPKGYGQGKNKYLTRPLNEAMADMAGRIARRLRILQK